MNPLVRQWGKVSAGTGGVQQTILRCHARLVEEGLSAEVLDLARPRWFVHAAPRALTNAKAVIDVFHASSPRSVPLHALLAAPSRHAILYVHAPIPGGKSSLGEPPPLRSITRKALKVPDAVWVTNSDLGDVVADAGIEPVVVSPYVPMAPVAVERAPRPPVPEGRPLHIVVAVYRGLELYGGMIAVDAAQLLLDIGRRLTLTVLLYGDLRQADGTFLAATRVGERQGWLRVARSLSPDEANAVVASADVFLRPTSSDGDSLMLREALAAGTRVIATACCPRPAGCELADRNAHAFARVVDSRGPIASGEGLGVPYLETLLELLHTVR